MFGYYVDSTEEGNCKIWTSI